LPLRLSTQVEAAGKSKKGDKQSETVGVNVISSNKKTPPMPWRKPLFEAPNFKWVFCLQLLFSWSDKKLPDYLLVGSNWQQLTPTSQGFIYPKNKATLSY